MMKKFIYLSPLLFINLAFASSTTTDGLLDDFIAYTTSLMQGSVGLAIVLLGLFFAAIAIWKGHIQTCGYIFGAAMVCRFAPTISYKLMGLSAETSNQSILEKLTNLVDSNRYDFVLCAMAALLISSLVVKKLKEQKNV